MPLYNCQIQVYEGFPEGWAVAKVVEIDRETKQEVKPPKYQAIHREHGRRGPMHDSPRACIPEMVDA